MLAACELMACSGGDALVEPLCLTLRRGDPALPVRSWESRRAQATEIVKSERHSPVIIEKELFIDLCKRLLKGRARQSKHTRWSRNCARTVNWTAEAYRFRRPERKALPSLSAAQSGGFSPARAADLSGGLSPAGASDRSGGHSPVDEESQCEIPGTRSSGNVSHPGSIFLDFVPLFLVCSRDEWKVVYDDGNGHPL